MENIYKGVYVGDDADYARIQYKAEWACLRCCKYGPNGHQDILDYNTLAAPDGPKKYFVKASNRLAAINLLDLEHLDAEKFIPTDAIIKGLKFVQSTRQTAEKTLIACNQGHSRGPSVGLLYLRAIGDMPYDFARAQKIYRVLYHKYSPGLAMHAFTKDHWEDFKDILL